MHFAINQPNEKYVSTIKSSVHNSQFRDEPFGNNIGSVSCLSSKKGILFQQRLDSIGERDAALSDTLHAFPILQLLDIEHQYQENKSHHFFKRNIKNRNQRIYVF